MSFKLYLDNKGVGAHDVVPNEEHIVSLAKKIWDGMGWILGSFSRGGVPVHHTNGVHQLVGTGAREGLGFESGKTPKFHNPF